MRRSVFFLTPLIPLAVAACEDGPAQTFQPATGTLWNNGDTPAAVADAGDPFNTTFGGTNKTQICTGSELQQQWGEMINQPIAPARFMAGLDLDNGPTFPLITVEEAETGPLFPVEFACVSNPPINPKNAQDGFYGYIPGSPPAATDTCLQYSTQTTCMAASNAQLATKGNVCGWNVIPATTTYLQQTKAPTKLCQPTVLGAGGNGADYGGSILVAWGNNQEFEMEWAIPTHKAIYMALNPGYNGYLEWNYLTPTTTTPPGDGKLHSYVYQIGKTILKDGVTFKIAWSDQSAAGYTSQVDELYRGIASTYAPDIYDDAPVGVTCKDTGTCLAVNNAGDGTGRALFGMRPVSFYMFFDPPTLPDPSGFTIQSGYLFNIKYAPYSGIHSYFKMYDPADASGAEPFGDGLVGSLSPQAHCHFGMGDTFQNLLTNCIDVFPKAAAGQTDPNATAQNKVLGDLSHDDQNFTFAVVGINQNFRPVKLDICLGPKPAAGQPGANCGTDTQDVIHDTDSPLDDPNDNLANTFDSDVRSFGAILNDSYADPTSPATAVNYKHDYHGSGAVWREYGRLVQTQMASAYATAHNTTPKALHDPSCFFPEQCSDGFSTTPSQCGAVAASCGDCATNTTQPTCIADKTNGPAGTCKWDATAAAGAGACYTPQATCSAISGGCAYALPPMGDTSPGDSSCTGGSWHQSNLMTMSPITACTTNANCTAINPAATCNLAAANAPTGIGLTPNTCSVPFDVNSWRSAPGCTGFETFITTAEAAAPATPDPFFPTAGDDLWDVPYFGSYGGSFKPGTPYGLFCNDPGTYNFCGLDGDVQGLINDLLDASASRVLQYLGNGNVLAVPTEGRDRRYFFKEWSLAYAKYLISPAVLNLGLASGAGVTPGSTNPNCTDPQCGVQVGQFANQFIDSDNIIFDSIGGGASRSEFIDFDFADATHDPVDIEQRTIIIGTNLQSTDFFRKLDREERALFNVLAVDRTQASWGYLHDSTGALETDAYPALPTTACATDADCTKVTTNWTCDTTAKSCVSNFNRHNANPFLTNLAGSAALAAVGWAPAANATGGHVAAPTTWFDPCNPVPPAGTTCAADSDCPGVMACSGGACVQAKTAYFCATHLNDPDCAAGGSQNPPTDSSRNMLLRDNGKPLLEGYCGVFQANPFTLQSNAVTPANPGGAGVGIEIVKTFPDEGEALVSLPTFPNPYAPDLTKNKSPVLVMVPWLPYQDGVGYPVSTNGSEDVFVVTAQLDFTGQVITPTLDYFPVLYNDDPNPNNPTPPYGIAVQAWETQDFLGDVFLCVDPVTAANRPLPGSGAPGVGDILNAHMYSSAETIIDWIASHPGAQDACGIIVRYSPYDNYPDFISSLVNGIRLDVEQGAGYGRIVDATVYAPGTGALAPP